MRIPLTLLSVALFALPASADPITTLYGTGFDTAGYQLGGGVSDPNYVVVEMGTPAYVLTDTTAYAANDAGSQWVWEHSGGEPINVTRTFRTTFDLTGYDPSTAVIDGQWAADNFGVDILINGISTGHSLPTFTKWNFKSLHPFLITEGFQSGLNTLDFVIRDVGKIAAFRTELSGSADPKPVPEPSTLLLLGAGLAVVGGCRRRRRR